MDPKNTIENVGSDWLSGGKQKSMQTVMMEVEVSGCCGWDMI
jgi:hypothetical protein